ncbi:hypothetical protein LG275_03675 [Chryseomicrobium palamuruense]
MKRSIDIYNENTITSSNEKASELQFVESSDLHKRDSVTIYSTLKVTEQNRFTTETVI